jgi:hypothetical protein
MLGSNIPLNNKIFWRKKAQTNICIAKELADIFGGAKADYLKKLNQRLRIKIADHYGLYCNPYVKAA